MEVGECFVITLPQNFEEMHHSNVSEETKEFKKESKQTRKRKLSDPSKFAFHCHCGKNFSKIKNLNYHRRQVHNEAVSTLKPPKKMCPLCDFSSTYHNDMVNHYKSSHNIHIVEEKLLFLTEKEFLKWKTNIEAETVARFRINESPNWASKKHKTTKYSCNRSGHYQTKGQGKRSLKKRGSIKINGYCPARIIKQLQTDGSCTVQFISAHVGHETEVHCLHLSTMEREEIAKKINMNIPYSKILDEIRDSSESESNLQRIHFLTRKDLHNIEASYKIHSQSQLFRKHCISDFNQWSAEMQNEGDCVLFYKPLGTFLDDHENLNSNDVVLILMSASQLDIFKKYGNNCVCIEATKEDLVSNDGENFKLHTLLVLDELEEAFPCAFLISNKLDVYVLQLFFEQIQLKAGKLFKPKVFMSGLEEQYFDAWISVMDIPGKRIYSSWIVDQTWRENLSKIDCQDLQIATYKHLRDLLSKRDATSFHKMLDDFISIDNPEYLDFINYFRDNFSVNFEYWAYCYTGLNSNTSLERMCNSISQLYQKGKNGQKLNRGIEAIMRFVRDKVINKLTINNNEKIRHKIKTIKLRHKAMENMNPTTLIQSEDGWEVVAQSEKKIYQIQKQETYCEDCPLICKPCNVCLHQFQCSCLDSAVKYNICKHIHFVARFIQNPSPIEEEIVFVAEDDSITTTQVNEENNDLEMQKEELKKYVTDVIDNCTTHEQLNVIREALDQINLQLDSMSLI
ncbi:unnamed protein product [Ceutorhynchus assimilis]|uniref:C2H2-type domain-containing protein n=1 Tax=Ceutorhynchus assimilis TaxID=467358 RepID=A0A9N9QJR4_9CUCU|nr:unnamed protein product [Ceutorhynchus assimilis]